jgi:hypothetical protein
MNENKTDFPLQEAGRGGSCDRRVATEAVVFLASA